MPQPTPVLLIAGLDPTDQEVTAANVQFDLPGAAVVRLGIDGAAGLVTWQVSDFTGIVEDDSHEVAHPCLSCSMREAILPTLLRLARAQRWQCLVVTLPVGAEPMPMALALHGAHVEGRPVRTTLDLRSVVTVVSSPDLCAGIFDDPLLADLGLTMIADDRRSYGEALAAQIEYADAIVLAHGELDESDTALLEHLRRPDSRVHRGFDNLQAGVDLLTRRHDACAARRFVDPRHRAPTDTPEAGGIVTLDLRTWKALHPERLLANLEELGCGDIRARGSFWLPGRPHQAIAWDCAGAQLSIGTVGPWGRAERGTRIVATTDVETAPRLRAAFHECVMTDAEMVSARERWSGRADGFEDWLGDQAEAA